MKRVSSKILAILTLISFILNSILLMSVLSISFRLILRYPSNNLDVPISSIITSDLPTSNVITSDFIAVKTSTIITEKPRIIVSRSIKLDPHEDINNYVRTISATYNIDPSLVKGIIQTESEYIPTAKVGECLGLMQVSKRWHSKRAERLGVTNFYDPYGNILIGVDYLAELFANYKDPSLVLMLYNMDHKTAFKMYAEGKTTDYVKLVLARAEVYRKGG